MGGFYLLSSRDKKCDWNEDRQDNADGLADLAAMGAGDEAAEEFADGDGVRPKGSGGLRSSGVVVFGDVEEGADFAAGRPGDVVEMEFFGSAGAFRALGDVGHDRHRRPLDLVAKPEILGQRGLPHQDVDFVHQLSCALQYLQIFEFHRALNIQNSEFELAGSEGAGEVFDGGGLDGGFEQGSKAGFVL